MDENESSDYKKLANTLKDEANIAFQSGDIEKSIALYTQAITIDPDNYVLYSNRSAAYMKSDSKSKALKDAEKCVEVAPAWAKGYSRLGAAQQGLKRFNEAIDSFKKGIQLDPSNSSLWSALSQCQEALENEKKIRYAEASRERILEEERLQKKDEEKKKELEEKSTQELQNFLTELGGSLNEVTSSSSSKDPTNEDLLSGFFNELNNQPGVTKSSSSSNSIVKSESKYANQDLGDAESQYARLTRKNYEWRNLNPYYVLQLDIDATEEDIKLRYKNLSRKVHPDKLRNKENAREAFEQVLIYDFDIHHNFT